NLDAWRRMHRGTNSLIGSMVAIGSAEGTMRLFADMLAALPAGESVPDACTRALRPIEAADVDRCAEMAGEFASSRSAIDFAVAPIDDPRRLPPSRIAGRVLFDKLQWTAWLAEQDARYCEEPPNTLLADSPHAAFERGPLQRLECISSVSGCIVADIAAPEYVQYDVRTLDFAAHLRLAAALLWLRDTAGAQPVAQRFEQRPAALRSGRRASGYDASSGTLFVDNLWKAREPRFALAIGAARAVASK
ncbi:MAG TPA: hypothetical protein VFV97_09365, partial [Rhodanobacteraceae bacterium]|nr:hypothetical protein [Rhodanobacteraceae bacterium]